MRWLPVLIFVVGLCGSAEPQTAPSESQTLQSLLTEVRALRQELRASLNRAQTMQILLARLQLQEGAITRSSAHRDDARQKLSDTRVSQKELTSELKRLEDSLSTAENVQEQKDLQDRIRRIKSELEINANLFQQRQTTENQAEQQLRDEQDTLSALESQLDELTRTAGTSIQQSAAPVR